MATLAVQAINRDGIEPSYDAASGGGDDFRPDDETFIHVKNGGGGSVTVTIITPKQVGGEEIADRAVAVPAGEERIIGPFPRNLFADPADGQADITYSGVTSVTIGVFKVD